MNEMTIRQLVMDYLKQFHPQLYEETRLCHDFKLNFIPQEESGVEYKHRATWTAKLFLDILGESGMVFHLSIDICVDDETGEVWEPPDPFKKQTPQEKRAARKERRQRRRNQSNL